MKALRYLQISGAVLTIVGLLGVAPTLYYRYTLASTNAAPTTIPVAQKVKPAGPNMVTGHPISISIPSVKISDSVIDGLYNQKTKQWTLTLDKAQFATISTQPNNIEGDTYIYGHYRPEVFAYLHTIKPGSEAYVTTDNGYRFTYQFQETHATSPQDSSIFAYSGKPILTLQTCSGAWFQNRQQFTFNLVGYQKV